MANITISPLSKALIIESNSIYEDIVNITNNDDNSIDFEMYATPYNREKQDFTEETASTQISRWITFLDSDGSYSDNPHLTAGPHETVDVHYKISTPNGIPASDQYAVIFARTITPSTGGTGVHAEISPGVIIYGHTDEEIMTHDSDAGTTTKYFSFFPFSFLLLTFLTIWIIVVIRKRKER